MKPSWWTFPSLQELWPTLLTLVELLQTKQPCFHMPLVPRVLSTLRLLYWRFAIRTKQTIRSLSLTCSTWIISRVYLHKICLPSASPSILQSPVTITAVLSIIESLMPLVLNESLPNFKPLLQPSSAFESQHCSLVGCNIVWLSSVSSFNSFLIPMYLMSNCLEIRVGWKVALKKC